VTRTFTYQGDWSLVLLSLPPDAETMKLEVRVNLPCGLLAKRAVFRAASDSGRIFALGAITEWVEGFERRNDCQILFPWRPRQADRPTRNRYPWWAIRKSVSDTAIMARMGQRA
jgi:hypothetical protein